MPRCGDGSAHFLSGDLPFFFTFGNKAVGNRFLAGKGDKGADIVHLSLGNGLHIVFQVLRIGHDNGAIKVVLRAFRFLMFIEHTGMEDGLYAVVDQPLDMTVGQLGGIALRL